MKNSQGYKDPDYMTKWKASHAEHIRAYRKLYYSRTSEQQKANSIEWQKNNHDRFLLISRACAANRRYPGKLTVSDVVEIIEKHNRTCHWCKATNLEGRNLTLEHLKPINDPAHIVVACLPCNAAKLHHGKRTHRRTAEEIRAQDVARVSKWTEENREKHREYLRNYYLAHRVLKPPRVLKTEAEKKETARRYNEKYYRENDGAERTRQYRLKMKIAAQTT